MAAAAGAQEPYARRAGRAGRGAGGGAGRGPPLCLAGSGGASALAPPRAARHPTRAGPSTPPRPEESTGPAAQEGRPRCGPVPGCSLRLLRGQRAPWWSRPGFCVRRRRVSSAEDSSGAAERARQMLPLRPRPRRMVEPAASLPVRGLGGPPFPQSPRAAEFSPLWSPRPWLSCEYRGPHRRSRTRRGGPHGPGSGRPELRPRLRAVRDRGASAASVRA